MIKFIIGYVWTQIQTTIHKIWIIWYTLKFCFKLLSFAIIHDLSKYSWVEAKGFASTIFDLKRSTYGTEEYKRLLQKIDPSIQNHYKKNAHHPEFYNNIKEMPLIHKIEMIIDWKSATRRHKNGDLKKSIEINNKRFNLSKNDLETLTQIALIIDKKSFQN